MTKKYFVISDIHGQYDEFVKLLEEWNKEDQLVLMGDYIDRGPDSYRVLKLALKLKEKYGAWTLLGNHEDMFIRTEPGYENMDSIVQGGLDLHMYNGGGPFYDSFPMEKDLFDYPSLYEGLKTEHPEIVSFIHDLELYKETESIVFVHAGVDPNSLNWQDDYDNCLWIREQFLYRKTLEKRLIVFGHTPTRSMNEYLDDSELTANFNKLKGTEYTSKDAINNGANINQPWIKDNKLGIDGGSVNRGRLNAVLLNDDGDIIEYYFV